MELMLYLYLKLSLYYNSVGSVNCERMPHFCVDIVN